MSNIDEKKAPVSGEGNEEQKHADGTENDPDKRKADSAFDDLDIEIDESEVESELRGQPRRKY